MLLYAEKMEELKSGATKRPGEGEKGRKGKLSGSSPDASLWDSDGGKQRQQMGIQRDLGWS